MSAPAYYILARFTSVLGLQFLATGFVLCALKMGAGPGFLGSMGLAAAVASLLSSFQLGRWVDVLDRKLAMRASQLLLVVFGMTLAGTSLEHPTGLLLAAGLFAILRNFRSISQFSIFGEVLRPLPHPEKWINLSTLSWQIAFVIGPLIASTVFSAQGARGLFASAAGALGAGFWLQTRIALHLASSDRGDRADHANHATPAAPARRMGPWIEEFREVRDFFVSQPRMRLALGLDFVVVMFAGASAILPFLHGSPASPLQVGLLRAAMPLGVCLASSGFVVRPVAMHWRGGLVLATFGFGLCHLLLSYSVFPWVSFLLLVAGGLFDGLSLSVREVMMQVATPRELKGRVYALNGFLVNASDELGEWESGVTAGWWGVRAALRAGACVTLVVSSAAGWRLLKLKKRRFEAVFDSSVRHLS